MDAAQRLDHLRDVIARITAEGPHLAAEVAVPTCPGWTVDDLVTHLGVVHRWAAEATEGTSRPTMGSDEDRRDQTLGEWYAARAKQLLDRLGSVDLGQECWTFGDGDRTVGFWVRRMLHESTIHGVDLGLAKGLEPEVPAEVAEDGVDELLALFAPTRISDPARALPLPLAIRATDTGAVWCVQEQDGDVDVARGEDGEVVGEIRGTAVQLYLALWGRGPRDELQVEGEGAAARGFLAQPLVP